MPPIRYGRETKRLAAPVTGALITAMLVVTSVALPCTAEAGTSPCPWVGFAIVQPRASSPNRAVKWVNATIFVKAITATGDITEIKVTPNGSDDATLGLKFNPAATKKLIAATNRHAGRRIAFVFGDKVLLNIAIPGTHGFEDQGAEVSLRHGKAILEELTKAIQGCIGPGSAEQKSEAH